jgi:hypothetical protein
MVILVEIILTYPIINYTRVFIFSHTLEVDDLNLTFSGITQLTWNNTLTQFGYVDLILTWAMMHTMLRWQIMECHHPS